jgi:glutamate-5-semialdehyde dehydrogenase
MEANVRDLATAKKNNLARGVLERLKFDAKKLADVCAGIEGLIKLDDPVGKILSRTELDTGLELYKVSCPIGVIGVVFESRPDALVQISTLCLKSGNACFLKGGSEAEHTNKILAGIISEASVKAGMPEGWLGLLEGREDVAEMLKAEEYIDLIIPRGSNQFVRYIMDNTNIPVLGHAEGICHVYVDGQADLNMAEKIVVDSKCQYVAVCNAAETLLVDEKIAKEFLPRIKRALEEKGVEIRGCEKTCGILKEEDRRQKTEDRGRKTEDRRQRTEDRGQRTEDRGQRTEDRGQKTEDRGQRTEDRGQRTEDRRQEASCKAAAEADWSTEYLDYIISIKVVAGLDEAVEHINRYGSGHTDAIVTADKKKAERFMDLVDSANVFWNCSTRFSDGYRYGLGAEVGISTNKIHARGPVGLDGLVIYKWKLIGSGQTVKEYAEGKKRFTHKKLFLS